MHMPVLCLDWTALKVKQIPSVNCLDEPIPKWIALVMISFASPIFKSTLKVRYQHLLKH